MWHNLENIYVLKSFPKFPRKSLKPSFTQKHSLLAHNPTSTV